MGQATIIGIDLAKTVFQIHGSMADGSVAFRKKMSRAKLNRAGFAGGSNSQIGWSHHEHYDQQIFT
ncbi:transposase [Rhodoblastus sphagnicola]|nr:hypothetical protein [Rhodoblastus sphagnicola]MBB4201100.1 transposase [Rhodoblastus sphagnicola]